MKSPAFSIATATLGMLIASCTAKTEPFSCGKDSCYFCKMGIVHAKYGGEVVRKKSKVYKFDDVICVSRFLKGGTTPEKDIKQTVVINFEKQNDFFDINKTVFVVAAEVRSPMNSNAAAFASKEAAEKFNTGKAGIVLSWKELQSKLQ